MDKKPKGIGLMIAVGKPAGAPPPRYKATPDGGPKESPRPAPSGKGGDPAPDQSSNRPGQDMEELAESNVSDPMAEMLAPLTDLGLPEDEARATLGKLFTALAKCCAGDGIAQHDAGGMNMEGSDEYAR